jgi:hypothetical protein
MTPRTEAWASVGPAPRPSPRCWLLRTGGTAVPPAIPAARASDRGCRHAMGPLGVLPDPAQARHVRVGPARPGQGHEQGRRADALRWRCRTACRGGCGCRMRSSSTSRLPDPTMPGERARGLSGRALPVMEITRPVHGILGGAHGQRALVRIERIDAEIFRRWITLPWSCSTKVGTSYSPRYRRSEPSACGHAAAARSRRPLPRLPSARGAGMPPSVRVEPHDRCPPKPAIRSRVTVQLLPCRSIRSRSQCGVRGEREMRRNRSPEAQPIGRGLEADSVARSENRLLQSVRIIMRDQLAFGVAAGRCQALLAGSSRAVPCTDPRGGRSWFGSAGRAGLHLRNGETSRLALSCWPRPPHGPPPR